MSTDTKTRRSNIKKTVLIIGKTRKIHSASSIFSQAARYFFEPPKPKRSGEKIHNFDSSSWLCRIWNAAVSQKSGYVNISEFIRILTSFNYWMSSLRWSRFFYSFFSRRVSFFFHFTFKKILFFWHRTATKLFPSCHLAGCRCEFDVFAHFSDVIRLMNVTLYGSSAHSISLECVFFWWKYN